MSLGWPNTWPNDIELQSWTNDQHHEQLDVDLTTMRVAMVLVHQVVDAKLRAAARTNPESFRSILEKLKPVRDREQRRAAVLEAAVQRLEAVLAQPAPA